jgi:hypothetical protein
VLLRWNHRLDYVPLFISQVCGIPSARNHSKASWRAYDPDMSLMDEKIRPGVNFPEK